MKLVHFALRRSVSIVVIVITLAIFASLAVVRMPIDIFPNLGAPAIYVAQPYGGMDPSQMEGFLTYYFEYHFLYITGIEHVESKSIQGASLMKLVFHPGTDMSQAMAEVVGYVSRARAFMPPGTVGPFITRFDAGSVPVGQLVFTSNTQRPAGELQDIALNRVRPLFATLEGVSAPPPFGGNQKTVVVRVQPEKLRQYHLSPEEVITAVNRASTVLPAGNVRAGDLNYIASSNAVLGGKLDELLDAPVRDGVYLRDVATIETGTDIVTGYAHVNGKRTVYIQVTKRADASTLRVIERVKAALPDMRKVCPDDVNVTLEFDQSGYVSSAINNLASEGILGAILTGLVVLLFLRDWRGALIVITTIPAALFSAVVALWAFGQTINIMTLGGLALAVGVLVDEATVEIENIHTHMATGLSRAEAVLIACRKTATPRLLALVAILAVFVPAYFMTGVVRQLFWPLALAVACAMVSSYLLSSSLVPVMATRLLREHRDDRPKREGLYGHYLDLVLRFRWILVPVYLVTTIGLLFVLMPHIGREVFPPAGDDLFQLRLQAPAGTRIEKTEKIALAVLDVIQREAGKDNVAITTGFIGVQPPSYPINTIFLWTSGPQEAVLKVELKKTASIRGEALRERLRAALHKEFPDTSFSFEPGDIIGQVMSFGSSTPIEVAVQGPSLPNNRTHAAKIQAELAKVQSLRDLQYAQSMDYPTLEVKIDRQRAGQFGLSMSQVAKSMVAATSSSRFVEPNYWRDPASGNAFQIQVEIPYQRMDSIDALRGVPVMENGEARPLLGDLATVTTGKTMGMVERYNMQRVISLTANVHGVALSEAADEIAKAVKRAGEPPKGVTVRLRGQIPPLEVTQTSLKWGVLASFLAIFLLLSAFFESFRVSFSVLLTAPAVLLGVALSLWITGTTLNVQSFLGAIMATGIAVANSILLCSFAEAARAETGDAPAAAREGALGRLRAVLMTATAMTCGMLPLALGSAQTAPLGRAVIGGLLLATVSTLTILPAVYALVMRGAKRRSHEVA